MLKEMNCITMIARIEEGIISWNIFRSKYTEVASFIKRYTRGKRHLEQEQKFSCLQQNCREGCCGAYNGFSKSLTSVDKRDFKDILLTDRDAISLLNSKYREYVYQGSDGLYRILTAEDGCCKAYHNGKCLIEEVKPTICKCYPLYFDIFVGICSQLSCPAVDSCSDLWYYEDELLPLLNMCEFWITYYKKRIEQKK